MQAVRFDSRFNVTKALTCSGARSKTCKKPLVTIAAGSKAFFNKEMRALFARG